ncbi:MAG: hypothetical protein CL955_10130 [Erythrobacteraceae bacterium]|nr:hypothetical protein [Erythrobacteraceae bacterium]
MVIRALKLGLVPLALAGIAACSEETAPPPVDVLAQDPQLARALHDPLMVDPDLAWRTEANAVVAFRDGHPLPPIEAREDAANRAREASRLELLENGQIPSLPGYSGDSGVSLATVATADGMLDAVGGRTDCVPRMDASLSWSTRMPPTSSVMPHGMVQQAAGADVGTCVVRVVRYLVPVAVEDVLEYHFTKVDRERFDITLYKTPEAQLVAERRDQKLSVNVRPGPGGMTAVDVVHWRK